MMRGKFLPAFVYLLCAFGSPAFGQPDLNRAAQMEQWLVIPDYAQPNRYYFAPGKLQLVVDAAGKPDAMFLMMRYTGTELDARANRIFYNSLFQCRVVMEQIGGKRLQEIRQKLEAQTGRPISLDPLPIWNVETQLVVPSVNGPEKKLSAVVEEETPAPSGIFWTERLFTVKLGNEDAQLLQKALSLKQTTLHIQYTYHTRVILSKRNELETAVRTQSGDTLSFSQKVEVTKDSASALAPVFSDAFALAIDLEKHPDLMRKVDINSQAPPGYALLEIRCYDFNNALRKDLFGKRIEIEAESVGGQKVVIRKTFMAVQPDIFVQFARFQYAVKLDRPFRYRIVELSTGKQNQPGPWVTQKNWNALIDISLK